jgi:hypothetical protein
VLHAEKEDDAVSAHQRIWRAGRGRHADRAQKSARWAQKLHIGQCRDLWRNHQRQEQQETRQLAAFGIGQPDQKRHRCAQSQRQQGPEKRRIERVDGRPLRGATAEALDQWAEIKAILANKSGKNQSANRQCGQAADCDQRHDEWAHSLES